MLAYTMSSRTHSHRRLVSKAATSCLVAALSLFGASPSEAAEVIPVRFIDGLPVIEVQLGAIRADFLLDTGGQLGITVPQPLINSATGVKLGIEQRKMVDAAGKVFMVQSVVASTLRLGAAELGPVDGLVNYKWGLKVGPGDAPEVTNKGAIGLGALSSRNVLLDLGAGQIMLFDKGEPSRLDAAGWPSVPFTYDKSGVVIQIDVNGATAARSLDTAATTSMLRKDAKLFASIASPCSGKPRTATFCGMKRLGGVQAGKSHLGSLTVAVVQMGSVPFDGLLGIDFFLARKVFIDFDSKVILIQDTARSASIR